MLVEIPNQRTTSGKIAGYAFTKRSFEAHTAECATITEIVMITGIGIASQQANEPQQNFNSACEFSNIAHKGSAFLHGYGSRNTIE